MKKRINVNGGSGFDGVDDGFDFINQCFAFNDEQAHAVT